MSVYRRGASPYWYFDVTVNGKRKRVSTKRTLKREALVVADEYRRDLLDRIQRGGGVADLSVKEALYDHYLPTKVGNPRYAEYQHHCDKVLGLKDGYPALLDADRPFFDLTESAMRQYRSKRKAMGASDQTVDHELKVVSAAYNLVKADFRVRPGLKFPMVRPKGKPRYLLPDEEEALLTHLDPDRPLGRGEGYLVGTSAQVRRQRQDNFDLAVMLLDTGARFGEIAGLTWDMVDTQGWSWVHIYRPKVDNEGKLATTARVREVLMRRHAERGNRFYVFPAWGDTKDVPRGSTAAIRRAINAVGINHPAKVARFGRRDVRSLRDTFASKLRQKGMSLDRLQKLLGHASPQMTQKYAHLNVDQASEEAVAILDQLNGAE